MICHARLFLIFVILGTFVPVATAGQPMRMLFDFDTPSGINQWQIVNDGVMGGRSSSRVEHAGDGKMRFTGTLSLENNGGFASVRSLASELGLENGQVIVIRAKGDGRKYTFNLYIPGRRTAFSYQSEFETKAREWIEVRMPIDRFVATSFGRPVTGISLDPAQVSSIGILLGDKKSGPFQMEIDWIGVD